jgi:hypothetical protein
LADKVRNYELLREGKDNAYESRKGSEMQGRDFLGIDGDFKSDSDLRVHRVNLDEVDPLLDSSVVNNRMVDGYYDGVVTEYLSPKQTQKLYNKWEKETLEEDKRLRRRKSQATPDNFNRALAEYYGQQALKLAGNKKVDDRSRSFNIVNSPNHPNSTLRTDRLIETKRGLLGADVGNPAGDYRFTRPDGSIGVGDMQIATYEPGQMPLEALVRLQALKGSKMSREQEQRFAGQLIKAAAQTDNIDTALEIMRKAGDLPQLVQGEIKRNKRKFDRDGNEITSGMRAGKMTSSGQYMGARNSQIEGRGRFDGPAAGQHRYDQVIYGINDTDSMKIPGSVPQAYINVDTAVARPYMNERAAKMQLQTRGLDADGSAFIPTTLKELLRDEVATNMVEQHPQIAQLLVKQGRQ